MSYSILHKRMLQSCAKEKWLDNEILQPDNHEQACERWGILGPASPRLPGMVRRAVLKFWQPCANRRIMEIMLSKQTRGGMIADSMGLGKTWEAIGVIGASALDRAGTK
ncbi:hypothetical protein BDV35DRAFT_162042 [Aspergillus flavus]|uniref:Uncharacterized protein n=1 Tax=Aspergillus flavus TaxID=5059 RepID=A0A5N6H7F6_ASPFL|nr:hypothetical protein BDV35DRAFT_162042 [Aspergillus flavus]